MDLGRAAAGAATGFATGNVPGAIVGGLMGMFGGGQKEDPNLRAMRQQQQQIANQLYQYGSSVPGSSNDELANMSQARGLLGQSQRANQQRAFSAWSPNQGLPAGQFMANLGNSAIAQQMSQQSSFLQDASANRRQALLSAAQVGQQAAGLYRPQPNQLGQIGGQLMQMLAYQQRQKQLAAQGQTSSDPSPISGGPVNGPAQPIDWQALGASGALGDPATIQGMTPGGAPPGMAQMLSQLGAQLGQQPGFGGQGMFNSITPGAPGNSGNLTVPMGNVGLQGAQAPGNEPFGMNGLQNQLRQSMGRSLNVGGGLRLRF